MKRLLSVGMLMVLLATMISLTSITASAAASGTHDNLRWTYQDGVLTISGSGEMKTVSSNEYPWDKYQYSATSIVISEGVTSIGKHAFFFFEATEIVFPLSLRVIGNRAFYDWSGAHVYYAGSKEDYKALVTDEGYNWALTRATWHYSPHSHQWTLSSSSAATCTANGYKKYTCHCGQTTTSTITMLGHNYTGNSYYTWTAVNGGYSVTAKIYCSRNSSHYLSETVQAVYKELTPASCTTDGEARYTATFVNQQFAAQTKTVTIAATGHSLTSVVTEPTCTLNGYTTHTCACGYSYVDTHVAAKGHDWRSIGITEEPTCIKAGKELFRCMVCKDEKTEPIGILPGTHRFSGWTQVDETTHKRVCADCFEERVAPHQWDSGVVSEPPSCDKGSITVRTCVDCKATKEIIGTALPHRYMLQYDENGHWKECSGCGDKIEEAAHSYGQWQVVKKAAYGEAGLKERICVACGHTQTEEIPALLFIPGDVNNNGAVTTDDAVYLLLYVMFDQDDYPVEEGMILDFDGNGWVETDDAVYLLLHVMFGPKDYPLPA